MIRTQEAKPIKESYTCIKCKISKPSIDFCNSYVLYSKYENFYCKQCHKEYNKQRHLRTYSYEQYKDKLLKSLEEV